MGEVLPGHWKRKGKALHRNKLEVFEEHKEGLSGGTIGNKEVGGRK